MPGRWRRVLWLLPELGPYRREDFIKPLWKQALGDGDCLVSDATGIIFAAAVTAALDSDAN
jgi:hypothetical protein